MHNRRTEARQPAGAAVRGLWLVRWLLVLVLIWDQVGLPLHHHHHDFGIDGQWVGATLHSGYPALTRATDGHEDLRITHAVLAVRPQFDLNAITVSDNPDGSSVASASILARAPDSVALEIEKADLSEPRQTYRSLPPAGRAPPLHT